MKYMQKQYKMKVLKKGDKSCIYQGLSCFCGNGFLGARAALRTSPVPPHHAALLVVPNRRLLPHAVAAMLTEQSKREGEPVDAPGVECRAGARVQGSVPTAWR